ncbi:MAG: Gfo/Idh/MocA family oxidoreductase, partial [Rhodospirillales bacterium]|nr:Gfo/Idh/MocA family oxidoreductase [Rhodospirillales bacterium]
MIKIGIIGYGYWGPNLLRNFAGSQRFQVTAVADASEQRRQAALCLAPQVHLFDSGEELIRSGMVDAVAIATPVRYHYPLARLAIEHGKHVLVEKPMCDQVDHAEDLVARAAAAGVALMVDHTFLFTGAVQSIGELVKSGKLGKLSYYDSVRVNLGLFQPDVNALWDLAPHDLSILDYLMDEDPVHVEAGGHCHVNPMLPDIVYLTLHFASDAVAHFNLSWMSPVKVRRVAVGGSEKMVVWDDLDRDEKIRIYDTGIQVHPEDERAVIIPQYR